MLQTHGKLIKKHLQLLVMISHFFKITQLTTLINNRVKIKIKSKTSNRRNKRY